MAGEIKHPDQAVSEEFAGFSFPIVKVSHWGIDCKCFFDHNFLEFAVCSFETCL